MSTEDALRSQLQRAHEELEAANAQRDQAQERFAVLWQFLQRVRTRDWTLNQLDERARELNDEGPAEIGINVVVRVSALEKQLQEERAANQELREQLKQERK